MKHLSPRRFGRVRPWAMTTIALLASALILGGCRRDVVPVHEQILHSAVGSPLFVRMVGDGPDTVIVLHGGPGLHAGYLVAPVKDLGRGHTFVLFDQRGRGRSADVADSASFTLQNDVDDLEALRSQLQLSKFSILAHHAGALIAVDYTLAHPDRVTRLALVGPMVPRSLYRFDLAFRAADSVAIARYRTALETEQPRIDPATFCRQNWGFFLGSERETDTAVMASLAPAMCDTAAFDMRRVDAANVRVVSALGAWDYRDRLKRTATPTLVIMGDRDKILVHAGRTWAYYLKASRILLLPSPPQFPWVGAERAFTKAAATFLAGEWPGDAAKPDAGQVTSPDDSTGQ